jgi:hypothetical protein
MKLESREISMPGEGDGTACPIIRQLWVLVVSEIKQNIFLCTNGQ